MEFISNSQSETKKIAGKILKLYPKQHIFLLYGDLGSGKTTFVQGLADTLSISNKIQSPTFVLEKQYKIFKKMSSYHLLKHLDLYRLKKEDEFLREVADEFRNTDELIIIEWPERLGNFSPTEYLKIEFLHRGDNKRLIVVNNCIKNRIIK